jgi:hypothetical protein
MLTIASIRLPDTSGGATTVFARTRRRESTFDRLNKDVANGAAIVAVLRARREQQPTARAKRVNA